VERSGRLRVLLGALGLGACFLCSVEGWSAVAYLAGLHGDLGRGMLPAFVALWVLVLWVPLGLATWAVWPLWRRLRLRQPSVWGSALAAFVLFGASVLWSHRLAQSTPTAAAASAFGEAELVSSLSTLQALAAQLPKGEPGTLALSVPSDCKAPPSQARVTLVATFLGRRRGLLAGEVDPGAERASGPQSACLQGESPAAVLAQLSALLLQRARRGPLLVDWVSRWQALSERHAWLDSLELRPGLDGVCAAGRCLMPGQLLAQGFFSTYRPVAFIPDFQFGVAPEQLRRAVSAPAGSGLRGLVRVETRSYLLQLEPGAAPATALLRLRRREVPVTRETLERGARAAESYVLGAQLPDGKFRYTLDPLTGVADDQSFNLARQAGTTLALCELGRETPDVRRAIESSLLALLGFERSVGALSALTSDPGAEQTRLGENTLPLVSLLSCAERLGSALPPSVAGLSRLLLAMQRPDGGFWPSFDLNTAASQPGPEPLYASGQAVLALVLLEARQRSHPDPALPPLERVQPAVQRAMDYFANEYWSHPLADFLFLEENWHCLAARAALPVHRHAGYEDFCARYVRFKARLILEREQGADPDFDGGFGFGNLVPPHNTGAAGFAEALAAQLALRRASGLDTTRDEILLRRVLGFLLRQQWTAENCFACATPGVLGGMSEHTHSLLTRIDFAQHAWAALGHGASILYPTP